MSGWRHATGRLLAYSGLACGALARRKEPCYPVVPLKVTTMDLSGIPCPLNWARAKARLESMAPGEQLLIVADDPRAERHVL